MIALRAELNQLDEIGCGPRPQIALANAWERTAQGDFGQRVETRFSSWHDLNFRLKKQIQFPGKRAFGATRPLGHGLNATQGFCAPRNDQARVAKLSPSQKNRRRRLHRANLALPALM